MIKARKLSTGDLPTHPDRSNLGAGRLATAFFVNQALNNQDRVIDHGLRVVAHVGLAGGTVWASDADLEPESGTQTHPDAATWRTVCRSIVRLTPGYLLRVRAACVLSGKQMYDDPVEGWIYTGQGGAIRVTVAYANGVDAPEVVQRVLVPKASNTEDGLEAAGAGASWAQVHVVSADPWPAGVLVSPTAARKWSDGVDASVVVQIKGSPRIVDLVVHEVPVVYARNPATDDAEDWATCLHTNGGSQPLAAYPSIYPVTRKSTADPSGGSEVALAVATRQARVFGPTILQWGPSPELTAVDETEVAPIEITSSTWVDVLAQHLTAWDVDHAGWGAGSAGMARRADLAGVLELRGKTAVVPVTFRVYARATDDTRPGALRLVAGDASVAEVAVTSETWGWITAPGWLECGVNGDVATSWQLLGMLGTGGSLELRYVAVDYAEQPA